MRVLAVDLGATNLRVALFEGGSLVRKAVTRTPQSPGDIIDTIVELAREISRESGVDAVGVASIGPLDIGRGDIVNPPNLPFKRLRLRDELGKKLGAKVVVANDCVAAVWGEYIYGRHSGVSNMGYVTISTGIGGGFIVDGELLLGSRGNAHEVGHIVVDYTSNIRCGCGGLGHWEALASGTGIPKLAQSLAKSWGGPETEALARSRGQVITPEEVFRLASEGDPFAVRVVEEVARIIAAGLASVAAAYDPEVLVLGGSVYLRNAEVLRPLIEEYLSAYAMEGSHFRIEDASFGDDEGLWGAYAIASRTPRKLEKYAYKPAPR